MNPQPTAPDLRDDSPRVVPERPLDERPRWGLIFALWTLPILPEITQALLDKSPADGSPQWRRLLVTGLFWYAWALLTPTIFRLARRFPLRAPRRLRSLGVHAAVATAIALPLIVFFTAFGPMDPESADSGPDGFAARFLRGLLLNYPVMLIIYSFLLWIGTARDLRRRYQRGMIQAARLETRTAQLEQRLAQARLQALSHQLQPHFLFNTLHAVSSLMDEDVPAARRMIARLGDLLRAALAADDRQEVPLEEEIEMLERYLDIERVRLGDRLRVEYEVASEALTTPVPSLLLQPLVENAVRHGVAPVSRPGTIHITARPDGEHLLMGVEDDGPGCRLEELEEGVGLANCRARLRHLYGTEGSLSIDSAPRQGFRASVRIPLSKSGAEDGGKA